MLLLEARGHAFAIHVLEPHGHAFVLRPGSYTQANALRGLTKLIAEAIDLPWLSNTELILELSISYYLNEEAFNLPEQPFATMRTFVLLQVNRSIGNRYLPLSPGDILAPKPSHVAIKFLTLDAVMSPKPTLADIDRYHAYTAGEASHHRETVQDRETI